MFRSRLSLFSAAALLAGAAHAAPPALLQTEVHATSLYGISRIDGDGSLTRHYTRDEALLATGEGDTAASALTTDAGQRAQWGIDLATGAAADFDAVAAHSNAVWSPVPGPAPAILPFESASTAHAALAYGAPTAGRVRFFARYELYASEGAVATIAFYGSGADGQADLYRRVGAGDGPAGLSGDWSSEWLDFDAEQAGAPSFQVGLHADTGATLTHSEYLAGGRWETYARITSWGYEVMPVPEPETYALLGSGLLALLAAGRRRRD